MRIVNVFLSSGRGVAFYLAMQFERRECAFSDALATPRRRRRRRCRRRRCRGGEVSDRLGEGQLAAH